MTRDEFREQMRPCRACGALCDGDVCDAYCEAILIAEAETDDDDDTEEPD